MCKLAVSGDEDPVVLAGTKGINRSNRSPGACAGLINRSAECDLVTIEAWMTDRAHDMAIYTGVYHCFMIPLNNIQLIDQRTATDTGESLGG